MNASVAIQVLPKVNSDEEVIRIVDEVIAYIKSTGLNYFVGPCETSIEGVYDELMEIVKGVMRSEIKVAKCVSHVSRKAAIVHAVPVPQTDTGG